ncbi:MAG: UDP-4-amino-4,6-dideoxy-N-acetyl-beta-L-altrosamine transaminase [Candidatus Acidiferrales bacterium]
MDVALTKSKQLAIEGGTPVRRVRLPYARQSVDAADIAAVTEVLRSDWLTTGPKVEEFERAFAREVGAREAVAVNSGTAALHAAMHAAGIGPGDEVIVPAITFVASANAVVYQGAAPVFADVDAQSLLVDVADVERKFTRRTRAILAVDYAGQPCDYDALGALAKEHNVSLLADAAHSIGGLFRERRVGTLAEQTAFSFHPVKHITTGEGGMVTCEDSRRAAAMRSFRNHGIDRDSQKRVAERSHGYQMTALGFNYRLTGLQCALGLSQLRKLQESVERRQDIAAQYDAAFEEIPGAKPLHKRAEVSHAYHLYVVRLEAARLAGARDEICWALEAEGIGTNVHYPPVHLHPFYRNRFGTCEGLCPVAEKAYREIVTLPLFPSMTDGDVADVIEAVQKVFEHFA